MEMRFPLTWLSCCSVQVNRSCETSPEFSVRGDGNTVDLDRTMGKLAENTLLYKTAAQLISRKFSGLKSAIRGGNK